MGTATILGAEYPTVVMPDGKEWMAADLEGGNGIAYSAPNPVTGKTSYFWTPTAGSMGALATQLLALPDGWRIPSPEEAEAMLLSVGPDTNYGIARVPGMRDNTGWTTPVVGAVNSTGFTALGNGRKGFTNVLEYAGQWFTMALWPVTSSLEYVVGSGSGFYVEVDNQTNYGKCVRLVRETSRIFTGVRIPKKVRATVGSTGTASILGRTYNTVILPDGKEWMASSLDYTPLTEYGGYNAGNVATIAALLADGWRFPTPTDAAALQALVPNDTELAKIRTTVGWTTTQGTNLWGLTLYPGGWLESKVLWHMTGEASLFWLSNASQVAEVTNTTFHINSASDYGGNLTSRKFTIRLVRDSWWSRAPEVRAARDREVGTTREVAILGRNYQTVVMPDGKEWLSENLQVDSTGVDYGNNSGNRATYGRLYSWAELSSLTLPDGWRVPTKDEWVALLALPAGSLKEVGTDHWESPNLGALNSFGFNARGGGYQQIGVNFFDLKYLGCWWNADATNVPPGTAYMVLRWDSAGGSMAATPPADYRFSVRLVRDNPRIWRRVSRILVAEGVKAIGASGSASILGTSYPTIVMPDNKEWLAANLKWIPESVSTAFPPNGDAGLVSTQGYLYDWAVVAEVDAKLAGTGWRVATYADGNALLSALPQDPYASRGISAADASWTNPTSNTNLFGLGVQGTGYRRSGTGGEPAFAYYAAGGMGNFWLSGRDAYKDRIQVFRDAPATELVGVFSGGPHQYFFSIRLVRDNVPRWREVT